MSNQHKNQILVCLGRIRKSDNAGCVDTCSNLNLNYILYGILTELDYIKRLISTSEVCKNRCRLSITTCASGMVGNSGLFHTSREQAR